MTLPPAHAQSTLPDAQWTILAGVDDAIGRIRGLEAKCTWPDRVDPRFASDLCAEVVRTAWRERGETV